MDVNVASSLPNGAVTDQLSSKRKKKKCQQDVGLTSKTCGFANHPHYWWLSSSLMFRLGNLCIYKSQKLMCQHLGSVLILTNNNCCFLPVFCVSYAFAVADDGHPKRGRLQVEWHLADAAPSLRHQLGSSRYMSSSLVNIYCTCQQYITQHKVILWVCAIKIHKWLCSKT